MDTFTWFKTRDYCIARYLVYVDPVDLASCLYFTRLHEEDETYRRVSLIAGDRFYYTMPPTVQCAQTVGI